MRSTSAFTQHIQLNHRPSFRFCKAELLPLTRFLWYLFLQILQVIFFPCFGFFGGGALSVSCRGMYSSRSHLASTALHKCISGISFTFTPQAYWNWCVAPQDHPVFSKCRQGRGTCAKFAIIALNASEDML